MAETAITARRRNSESDSRRAFLRGTLALAFVGRGVWAGGEEGDDVVVSDRGPTKLSFARARLRCGSRFFLRRVILRRANGRTAV